MLRNSSSQVCGCLLKSRHTVVPNRIRTLSVPHLIRKSVPHITTQTQPLPFYYSKRTLSLTTTHHRHERAHYRALGLPQTASQEEIRDAYLEKTKLFHPDTNPNDEEAQVKFLKAKEAYEVLRNSKKREAYDRTGRADEQHIHRSDEDHAIHEQHTYRNIPDRPLEFQMFSLEGVVLVALCCGLLYWSVTSHMEKRRKKHERDALLKRVMGDDIWAVCAVEAFFVL